MVTVVSEPVADQRSACIDCRGKIGLLHERHLTAVSRSGQPVVPPRDGRGWLAAARYSDSRMVAAAGLPVLTPAFRLGVTVRGGAGAVP